MMNLYLISQNVHNGWDTYDSAVVAAESEEAARSINPSGKKNWDGKADSWGTDGWCAKEDVNARLIGKAARGIQPGVVCASFNAG